MAEVIFNEICHIEDTTASSAGVSVIKGSMISENSLKALVEKLNSNIKNRVAVQLSEEIIEGADYIFTMTGTMKNYIVKLAPKCNEKIFALKEFIEVKGDVSDPYGGNYELYLYTYNEIKECILLLIDKLYEETTKTNNLNKEVK